MMKKLFLFSVAALAFCACSSDEVVSENSAANQQPKEISFAPLNKVNTRAAVQGTTFPTTNTMEVKAYQTQPSTAEYFTKTTFTYQFLGGALDATNNSSYWGGKPARYWPLSAAKLNFFAVSGAGVDASHITITDLLASASVAYTTTNSYSETTQSDIMYAFGREAVTQAGNILTFPSKVDMTFHHALALINFQIKAGNTASTAIKIKKIELNGARYTGTLAITNTNAATEAGAWSAKVDWTPEGVVDNVKVPNIGDETNPVALTTGLAPANSDPAVPTDWASLMIIPSTQTATVTQYGFTTIKITYVLDSKEYTYEYAPAGWTDDDSNPSTPDVATPTYVEAGKKYTYQITMTLHEILINPVVTDWTDGTGSPSNVNI